MGNKPVPSTDTQKIQETVKIGKTVFTVNHFFTPNKTKQAAWLSIITRVEGLKTGRN